jgi:AIR synthase-related protein
VNVEPGTLGSLTRALCARPELGYKRDIQLAARAFGRETRSALGREGATGSAPATITNGDDTAALPDEGGYVLFAAEGMRAEFVAADPWFAGFCSVLTNVNDVAAMGGRPWAVVDVLFHGSGENERVFEGMAAASATYGVPIVGGHTTRVAGASLLAAAVVGRARRLLPSSGARPGQALVAAISLNGSFRGPGGNFNAATTAPPAILRAQLALLPELAEAGLVAAAKDISMAGLCGTVLMMIEASGCGARIDLERVPAPGAVDPLRWLTAFPSFGFVLAVDRPDVSAVCARFDAVGVACAPIGEITGGRCLELRARDEHEVYWDLGAAPFTGFGA